MNLYLQFPTNLKLLELYHKDKSLVIGGNSKKEREIAQFFLENFPGELMNEQSPQYELNFLSIRKLKKLDKDIFNKVKGIYYGTDSCEYLMPTKEEIKKAFSLFKDIKRRDSIEGPFILNTPYLGGKMLERAKESIDYLAQETEGKIKIEIVINDFALLRYIEKNYKDKFNQLIMGRLLYKSLKTPLVDIYGNKAKVSGQEIKNKTIGEIKLKQENIVKWQNKYYNDSEESFSPYTNFLKRKGIKRKTLDFIKGREDLYNIKDLDLHFPYSLIFTGRLCDTSAIEQPERGNYAIDDICARTCFRYDLGYKIKSPDYHLLQKGNAGYRTSYDLDYLPTTFLKEKSNRLIFQPFL